MKACILRSPAPIETNPLRVHRRSKARAAVRAGAGSRECLWNLPHRSARDRGRACAAQVADHARPSGGRDDRSCGRGREALSDRNARGHRVAALHRRNLRILQARRRESLRSSELHRIHGGWRLRRVCAGRGKLRLSDPGWFRRSRRRAVAVRRNHRIPVPAHRERGARRTHRALRIWSRGARRNPGGAPLGR